MLFHWVPLEKASLSQAAAINHAVQAYQMGGLGQKLAIVPWNASAAPSPLISPRESPPISDDDSVRVQFVASAPDDIEWDEKGCPKIFSDLKVAWSEQSRCR